MSRESEIISLVSAPFPNQRFSADSDNCINHHERFRKDIFIWLVPLA